jgi:hypothetical protein
MKNKLMNLEPQNFALMRAYYSNERNRFKI